MFARSKDKTNPSGCMGKERVCSKQKKSEGILLILSVSVPPRVTCGVALHATSLGGALTYRLPTNHHSFSNLVDVKTIPLTSRSRDV